MKPISCAAAAALLLLLPGTAAAQTLNRYVKYETGGRTAWGVLEGETIRELQGTCSTVRSRAAAR